jgi:hypothetical protein
MPSLSSDGEIVGNNMLHRRVLIIIHIIATQK